jgi:serine O-acetyltransferase
MTSDSPAGLVSSLRREPESAEAAPPAGVQVAPDTQADADLQADLARYPARPFLKEQSIWAIWVYRFGRRTMTLKPGPLKNLRFWFYWWMFRTVETLTGISIDCQAVIGPGLRIYHFGNIFIHGRAVLGANCTLRQGVTIGVIGDDGPAPKIGDNVEFGAYAQVLGGIRVGDNAKIGALSLVLSDVPANLSAVGVPARSIFRRAKAAE